MQKKVVILDTDQRRCSELCDILARCDYQGIAQNSLAEMETFIGNNDCFVVIVDIDSISIDNRTIRDLTLRYPGVYFLCLSTDLFHPDLREALCYHIYACINKPVDPDELYYWLRSIFEDTKR